jgi:hypothetical protein
MAIDLSRTAGDPARNQLVLRTVLQACCDRTKVAAQPGLLVHVSDTAGSGRPSG